MDPKINQFHCAIIIIIVDKELIINYVQFILKNKPFLKKYSFLFAINFFISEINDFNSLFFCQISNSTELYRACKYATLETNSTLVVKLYHAHQCIHSFTCDHMIRNEIYDNFNASAVSVVFIFCITQSISAVTLNKSFESLC